MLRRIESKGRTLLGTLSIRGLGEKTKMSSDESMSVSDYVQLQKKKYAALSLPDKRQLYKCAKYYTLADIETWGDFAKRNNISAPAPLYERNDALNSKISTWSGDITQLEIDSIVNAANSSLLGGGGVDGAIHRAAGTDLKTECSLLNGCNTGDAKITFGYNLPAKYVIHTVGPIGEKPNDLVSCYFRSLSVCRENTLRSVAFPCISTGIYGYPNDRAVQVVLKTVREWLEKDDNAGTIDRIIFCLFLDVDKKLYAENLPKYFPVE